MSQKSPIIETARLQLREMTRDDIEFVSMMLGDPQVMRYYPRPFTRQQAEDWIEDQIWRYDEHGHGLWLVSTRDDDEPVGQVGLAIREVEGAPEREIGYLVHHSHWRRGIATESALGVRRWAWEEQELERVISLIRPENTPSQGVARKLGMRPTREVDYKGLRHTVWEASRPASG